MSPVRYPFSCLFFPSLFILFPPLPFVECAHGGEASRSHSSAVVDLAQLFKVIFQSTGLASWQLSGQCHNKIHRISPCLLSGSPGSMISLFLWLCWPQAAPCRGAGRLGRDSAAAAPAWHEWSSQLGTEHSRHWEGFAERCFCLSPGSLWVPLTLHSSSHADNKVKTIVYWLVYAKDSFAPGVRVTHITAKYIYFCRTKNAWVPVTDSTSSTLFKKKI